MFERKAGYIGELTEFEFNNMFEQTSKEKILTIKIRCYITEIMFLF
jgi:hypothetical protein